MTQLYALVDDTGTVTNVIVVEPDQGQTFGPGYVVTDQPGQPGIGWQTTDNGQTWTPPPEEP